MSELSRLLTVAETAAYLRVVPHTVYRWVSRGLIAPVRVGKALRIPADELARIAPPHWAGSPPLLDVRMGRDLDQGATHDGPPDDPP